MQWRPFAKVVSKSAEPSGTAPPTFAGMTCNREHKTGTLLVAYDKPHCKKMRYQIRVFVDAFPSSLNKAAPSLDCIDLSQIGWHQDSIN